MDQNNEYNVRLDVFEGPLDLLLYLVNRAEMNILEISVSHITRQYLQYLDVMQKLNINVAGDYLSMAATLLRLKAREMLPQSEQEDLGEDEDDIVDRRKLIERLLEYRKFKEAANSLRVYEGEQFGSFPRGLKEEFDPEPVSEEVTFGDINVFDLISAFQRIVERAKEQGNAPNGHVLQREDVKLDDRIERVLSLVSDENEVPLEELFADDYRRIVLVVTFMAILELVKMGEITFRQESQLGQIFVKKHVGPRMGDEPVETDEPSSGE